MCYCVATGQHVPRVMPAQQKQRAYSSVWNRRKKPPLMRPILAVEDDVV
jgi:hypothetical protein